MVGTVSGKIGRSCVTLPYLHEGLDAWHLDGLISDTCIKLTLTEGFQEHLKDLHA